MSRSQFPLFQSHLDLAHRYWQEIIRPGDHVVDATCGNGHDTLALAKMAITPEKGRVTAIDIQPNAIEATKKLVQTQLSYEITSRIDFVTGCHSFLENQFPRQSIKLIVYNLGYLPGTDKSLTTNVHTTWQSIQEALELIAYGGAISVTCYPGHPEGKLEEDYLIQQVALLDPKEWSCCHHRWLNRRSSPSLLLLQRKVFTT